MVFKRYTFKLDVSEDESNQSHTKFEKEEEEEEVTQRAMTYDADGIMTPTMLLLHCLPHSELKSLLEKMSLPTIGNTV